MNSSKCTNIPGAICILDWGHAGPCLLTGIAEPKLPLPEFLALLMCSDPWPVTDNGHGDGKEALNDYADAVARARGFASRIDAYHATNIGDAEPAASKSVEDGPSLADRLKASYTPEQWARIQAAASRVFQPKDRQ